MAEIVSEYLNEEHKKTQIILRIKGHINYIKDILIEGRTMTAGIAPISLAIKFSVNALVYVYVLGLPSEINQTQVVITVMTNSSFYFMISSLVVTRTSVSNVILIRL